MKNYNYFKICMTHYPEACDECLFSFNGYCVAAVKFNINDGCPLRKNTKHFVIVNKED